MASFRRWPLFDLLVGKYWSDEAGWTHQSDWESEDLRSLALFAGHELQRRGELSDANPDRVIH